MGGILLHSKGKGTGFVGKEKGGTPKNAALQPVI